MIKMQRSCQNFFYKTNSLAELLSPTFFGSASDVVLSSWPLASLSYRLSAWTRISQCQQTSKKIKVKMQK